MANVDWVLAGAIILTGLVVVFFVLLFLWLAVAMLGKICSLFKEEMPAPAPAAPVITSTATTLTPEIVAAISATIGCMHQGEFKITSIKQQGSSTNLWEA